MSPDPSGLLAQRPEDPQSWNLYTYARNNPLSNIDPTGLDCVYANDAGNGVESIDHNSNSGECGPIKTDRLTDEGRSLIKGLGREDHTPALVIVLSVLSVSWARKAKVLGS